MTRYPTSQTRLSGPYDLFGAARAVLALLKNVAQRVNNRRAVVDLLEWDDRALKDIGLMRTDVRLALGLPYSEDPSQRLATWATERRLARHPPIEAERKLAQPQLRVIRDAASASFSISRR